MGANTRFETLADVARHKGNIECRCSCGHNGIIHGEKLARWFFIHVWDARLISIRPRLRCSKCGARPEEIKVTAKAATAPDRFPRSEDSWKQKVKRLRD